MKMKAFCGVLGVALLTMASWAQEMSRIEGHVKDGTKPVPDVTVVITLQDTGRTWKMKADKSGAFSQVGIIHGVYTIEVLDANNKSIYKEPNHRIGGEGVDKLEVDISNAAGKPTASKEEIEKIKAQNAKATSMNTLINQYNAAQASKNWAEAEPVLVKMIEAEPTNWRFYQALGDVQSNQQKYEEAVSSYDKGIQGAQSVISANAPKDANKPESDPAKAKAGVGQMLASQGNAYIKLKKNPEAIAAFTKAAEMDPNPGIAYFNLCATQYNTGNTEGALVACDKAIAADPNKADAYFIKGSLMMGAGKLDAQGKYTAPAGTAETLNKYLEIAPDGPHANDVKAMLQAIGAKIETTYGTKTKKK
jgi:tetratricopeptide (TPR) repeat protein